MNDEETNQKEERIDATYASQFRQHLSDLQAHFKGEDTEKLSPSFIPPTGFWTCEEKDQFFHALSIHSRLRPDLIAASVGTKTVLDVCTYIDILDRALEEETDVLCFRDDMDVSMEMSESWVSWEEDRAVSMVASEAQWEGEHLESQEPDNTTSQVQDASSSPCADQEQRKVQEAFLRRLDAETLTVMDRILNETEDANFGRQADLHRFPEGSSPQASSPHDAPTHSPTEPDQVTSSDAMIADPIAASTSFAPGEPSGSHLSNSQEGVIPQRVATPPPDGVGGTNLDLSHLSPRSRRKLQKRLYMRRKRAAQSGAEIINATSKLRPGRKTKKVKTLGSPEAAQDPANQNVVDEEGESTSIGKSRKKIKIGGVTKPYKIKSEILSNGIDAYLLADNDLGLFRLSTLGRLIGIFGNGYKEESSHIATTISAETIKLLGTIAMEFVSDLIFHTINLHENQRRIKEGTLVYRLGEGEVNALSVERAKRVMGVQGCTLREYFAQLLEEDIDQLAVATKGKGHSYEPDVSSGSEAEWRDNTEEDEASDSGDQAPGKRASRTPNSSADPQSPPRKRKRGGPRPVRIDEPGNYPIRLPPNRELNPPFIHLPRALFPSSPLDSIVGTAKLDQTPEDVLPDMIDDDDLAQELQEDEELDHRDRRMALEYEVALWKGYSGDEPVAGDDLLLGNQAGPA